MGSVRRWPVLAVLAAVLVAGLSLSHLGIGNPSVPAAEAQVSSAAPTVALSDSWFCAGATAAPGSVASGELVFDNAGRAPVQGTVRLVSPVGYFRKMNVTVPAGATSTVVERFVGLPRRASKPWVGALVTLYSGMASVSQVVSTPEGPASQPCASAASTHWYFVDGATLRNASDHISLLNPYPVDAIADLSFTTEAGQENPAAFEGVLVPADGLTVINLGSHLRIREHIAVTVTARTGQVVAFQTELVTRPPAGSHLEGPHQGLNPAAPIYGATLALGSSQPSILVVVAGRLRRERPNRELHCLQPRAGRRPPLAGVALAGVGERPRQLIGANRPSLWHGGRQDQRATVGAAWNYVRRSPREHQRRPGRCRALGQCDPAVSDERTRHTTGPGSTI